MQKLFILLLMLGSPLAAAKTAASCSPQIPLESWETVDRCLIKEPAARTDMRAFRKRNDSEIDKAEHIKAIAAKYPKDIFLQALAAALHGDAGLVISQAEETRRRKEAAKTLAKLMMDAGPQHPYLLDFMEREYLYHSELYEPLYLSGARIKAQGRTRFGLGAMGIGASERAYQLFQAGEGVEARAWAERSVAAWKALVKGKEEDLIGNEYYTQALALLAESDKADDLLKKSIAVDEFRVAHAYWFDTYRQRLQTIRAAWAKGVTERPLTVLISSGDQDPFDPDQSAQALFTLRSSFFCAPLQLDREQQLKPDAVRSWQWSADRKTLTLELDPERRFHDGRPIEAKDLEFALIRPFLATKGNFTPALNIVGAEMLKRGSAFRSGLVSGIKSVDATHLTVTLKEADPDFLFYLASVSMAITPADALAADLATFKGTPVSCGDYQVLHAAADGSRYLLKKFRGPAEALDAIELWNYSFDTLPGKPDVMQGGLFPKDKIDGSFYRLQMNEVPSTAFTFYFNDKQEIVKYPAFRQAINLAMPRQAMAESRSEKPTMENNLPGPAFLGLPIRYDLIEAKRLWLSLPQDLRDKDYQLVVKTNYPGPYFKLIEESLRSIGMKARVVARQMKDFRNAEEQDVMLGMGSVLLRGSPIAMFRRLDENQSHPDPLPKSAQAELQKRFKRYAEALTPEDRKLRAQDIAHYVLDENWIVPMTLSSSMYALSPQVESYQGAVETGVNLRLLRKKDQSKGLNQHSGR